MACDGEESGSGLADGLVEEAGFLGGLGALVECLHGAGRDVECEQARSRFGEQAGGHGELVEVRALDVLDELGEGDVVCAADGRGAHGWVEDVVEQRVGCERVGVHFVILTLGGGVTRGKRRMYTNQRTSVEMRAGFLWFWL